MNEILVVDDMNFQEEVLDTELLVLVDFWAPRCGYCIKLLPVLEEINSDYSDKLKIVKVNVDENKNISQEFKIMSLPTMLIIKEGEVLEEIIGFLPKEIIISKITQYF